ncbi:6-phosphogluconolactonase [Buchananella felis]|uniref:6-phosphogluconolactonase n=1 Tax=Buchananella felis TaxID=3231492 RepID=UPI003529A2B9
MSKQVASRVVVLPDLEAAAELAGARLLDGIIADLSTQDVTHVVLTGGTAGIRMLVRAAANPLAAAVDWRRVHIWWGDERYLAENHPERNSFQAHTALLDHLPAPAHLHPIPGPPMALEQAGVEFARALVAHARVGDDLPRFDQVFLGVGPDGHVASIFPGHATLQAGGTVVVEANSPKPPAERVSLTLGALATAKRLTFLIAGADKGPVLGEIATDTDCALPAAVLDRLSGHHGAWLTDQPAMQASGLPGALER